MKTNNALVAVVALLILLLLVIVTSCGELSGDSRIKTNDGIIMKVHDFSYAGHDYIYFKSGSGKVGTGGVVHNPNCICKQ